MNFFRWMFGLPMAALATVALFLAMAGLIKRNPEITPGPYVETPIITAQIKESKPKPPVPTPTDLSKAPPPIDTRTHTKQGPVDPTFPPTSSGEGQPPIDGPGTFKIPVIKPAPIYPEACRARGAHGDVTVIYDVTDRGEVVNVRVASSEDHCLDSTAKQTVSKWKYPPGRQYGLVQTFTFQLES
ncbi:MAG TPA: energy transducer TonB [Parvularculaceae bacterium]|nr:energy transducer TonB [Parvularculaceae bacterium]